MKTELITVLKQSQKQDLLKLYHQAWWSKDRTEDHVDFILANSSLYVGIVDSQTNRLLGFLRVLTDYFKFAYIYDVIVDENHQNLGLGKQLIQSVMDHPSLQTIPYIELVCKKTKQSYYEQFGFTDNYGDSTSMRFVRPGVKSL